MHRLLTKATAATTLRVGQRFGTSVKPPRRSGCSLIGSCWGSSIRRSATEMAPKRSRFFAAPPENDGATSSTPPPSNKSRPSKKRQTGDGSSSSSPASRTTKQAGTTPMPTKALISKAAKIAEQLGATYPNPPIPLDHETPYQLLVAVVLSAQSTVRREGSRILMASQCLL